ncbi:M20/M25/M40 family metallo-hydrolase [Phytomonospora sp. NPDC050363]|uniref:M20 metallopeptidase family protein n=1 Tax=Phytomonospora sp. NPDC050363 TaxID=3155642 RepID=UPI0033D60353
MLDLQAAVNGAADLIDGELRDLRRDVHAHPELAGAENRTAALVATELRAAGLDVTVGVGGHGVVGVLTGVNPGRTVAYRADMDAVPPHEQFGGDGQAAHLCGHDVHTTVGVGVARVLAGMRERLSGRIVFVFQPAEETLEGARAMLDDDLLGRFGPDEIHALHCAPIEAGTFAVTPGTGMPGLDRAEITVTGSGAAGRARTLAGEIAGLSTVTPPATAAERERFVADLLTPDGPLARFVTVWAGVSERSTDGHAVVTAAFRCWPPDRHGEVRDTIRALASAQDRSLVDFPGEPFPAMVCGAADAEALREHLAEVSDGVVVARAAMPFNGEDFALFLDRLPGTYTYLGVRAPGADIATASPHAGSFDPDERAIGAGVKAMAGWLALRAGRA